MKKRILFLMLLNIVLYSCTTEHLENCEVNVIESKVAHLSKIDTSTIVDAKKAEHIAKHFQKQQNLTRVTGHKKKIKEIQTLKDENGKDLLYIVNYKDNQGFVIISAVQDYEPILAFENYGNFRLEDTEQSGVSLWLDQQKKTIKSVSQLPDSTKQAFRRMWTEYNIQKEEIPLTRSYNDVISFMYLKVYQWEQEGYEVFRYADIRDTPFFNELPSELIIQIRNAVDSADPRYGGRDNATFLLKKKNTKQEFVPTMLKTNWQQKNGFNQYVPNNSPVGCVPVAMGQIMKYHEYPKNYPWDQMANDYATPATANFLYNIGVNMGMEFKPDGSGANIDQALSAFKNKYGYTSAKKVEHSFASVHQELFAGRPVYMRGYDSSGFLGMKRKGHAWVCDGLLHQASYYEYQVFILEDTYDGSEPTEMSFIYKAEVSANSSSTYLHMNWGWNKYNGYFSDNDLWIHDENLNFAHGRQDIINIYPNN